MMVLPRLLLLGFEPLLGLASFLPGLLRPDSVGVRSQSRIGGQRQPNGSRHVRASLQQQRVNITRPLPELVNSKFHISPRWEREGLFGFGAGIVYMLELFLGTPQQKVSLILDTGSFAMLVDPDCVRAADATACQKYGYYNTSTSATARNLNSNFVAQFGTGYMEGYWFNETVFVGQDALPLPESRVGVNSWSNYMWAGILGASYGQAWNTQYATFLDSLVGEGYINVPIFSLGVGYQNPGSSGDIVFGGVDRWKFRGYLEPLEIWPKPAIQMANWQQVGYWVNITSLSISPPGQDETTLTTDNFSRMMLIDSGSTFTYIDASLVSQIAKAFNAQVDSRGVYYVSCDYRNQTGTVNFGFNHGNMVIRVTYADFIVDFTTYCALGVQAADAGETSWVLGNSFIRAAYIVFDQEDDAVWLAQYQPCSESGITDLTRDAGKELWLDVTGEC
ncbi:aspartic peptidase domain-containing protein [Xylariaceae sp. FL0016]|nr:aspartic peptidase domain-containing protein [Xylariaceae sp. FL0016]